MLLIGTGLIALVLSVRNRWKLDTTGLWVGLVCAGLPLAVGIIGLGIWVHCCYRDRKIEKWLAVEAKIQKSFANQPAAFHETLSLARLFGFAFTLVFVAMLIVYAAGKMDTGGVIFISFIAVFSIPLLAGSIMVSCRVPAGLWLLKFGALLLIVRPWLLIQVWQLDTDPELRQFLYGQQR
jgi:hypothetical protein